jgi:hypothetical protein
MQQRCAQFGPSCVWAQSSETTQYRNAVALIHHGQLLPKLKFTVK